MAPDRSKPASEDFVREMMWVTRRKGTHLSNSQRTPGEFSPLTRDESDELGQVTLSHISNLGDTSASYSEPIVVYGNDGPVQRSKEQNGLAELVSEVLSLLIAKGRPHAKRIWNEQARPALRSHIDQIAQRRALRRQRRASMQPVAAETAVAEPLRARTTASEELRANMSSADALARYLVALAARQLSDEQIQLLANVDIQEDEGLLGLQRGLSKASAGAGGEYG